MNVPAFNELEKLRKPRKDEPRVWIGSIDLDELAEFKVLWKKSEIRNFYQNNKQGVNFIQQFLSTRNQQQS